jgi:hypothetical protein
MSNECKTEVIMVRRVVDSAKLNMSFDHTMVTLDNVPSGAVEPFVFRSATSSYVEGTVTNLNVTRLPAPECGGNARIRCNITFPVMVRFTDANGIEYDTTGTITTYEDIVAVIPPPCCAAFEVVAYVNCNCPSGTFTANTTIDCVSCIVIVTKVVETVDLIINALGIQKSHPAQEYRHHICEEFFRRM